VAKAQAWAALLHLETTPETMASTAARFAVRVAAPVRASAVRRFTTSRAAKGGDGHNHPVSPCAVATDRMP